MSEERRLQLQRLLASGTLQPLSFPQRELWEASHVPAGDVANHICAFVEVKGVIQPQLCQDCMQMVVDRQEAMRVSILPGKSGPMQLIRHKAEANTTCVDVPHKLHSAEAMEDVMREHFRRPFDMLGGPLYRVTMLRRAPDDILLAFAIHHAISDGWSLGVFIQDLSAAWIQNLRGRKDPLPLPPMAYTQWAAAERAAWPASEVEAKLGFWKEHLKATSPLWPDTKPPSWELKRITKSLPPELALKVKELARRTGTTLFSTLLTAFQFAFAEWSGHHDFVVGTPVANRNRTAVRETMGYFASNVPIRMQVDPKRDFIESLRLTHTTSLDCFSHAMPHAELVRGLGEKPGSGRSPVYEVRFALQNHPVPDGDAPGLNLRLRMRSTGTTRMALACEVTEEGPQMEVVWLARPDLISQAEIDTLHRRMTEVLQTAC